MFFVRARATGTWRTIDLLDARGDKFGEKYIVMSAEAGRWCVNNVGVDVRPGLCVAFRDPHEADWFLQHRRGQVVSVEPESVVCFHDEADAHFFTTRGLGELMSSREVEAFFAAMNGGDPIVETEEDDEPEVTVETKPRRGRPSSKKGK